MPEIDELAEFVKGQRGDQLLHESFMYTFNVTRGEKRHWKCVEFKTARCLGKAHTVGDRVIKTTSHNHLARPDSVAAKKIMSSIKERARTVTDTPQQIVATATVGLQMSVAGKLPPVTSMKRTVQRTRSAVLGALPTPTSLRDLVIPERYTFSAKGEPFLLFDSGASNDRIIIFTTQSNLDAMASCEHWYADGTFKSTPPLFAQVYTIHGVRQNNVLPTVYALLPNKQENSYGRLLTALKQLKPALNPVSIMTDFEMAQINAFREQFDGITCRGCFFHFGQCLWRVIQANQDLRARYVDKDNPDFSLHVRQLCSLAFVPPADVTKAFQELLQTDFFVENDEVLEPLIIYFENTWIGRPPAVGIRRPPKFPQQLWNCYDGTLQNLPKTNNSVEGWHRSFSSLLESHHPSIWKFIEGLKLEQSLNELRINQYTAAYVPQVSRKVYKDTAAHIKTIVNEYHIRSLNEYLIGIAQNFQLQADS